MVLKVIIFLIIVVSTSSMVTENNPPKLLINRGGCPFECCTYQKWKMVKTTVAYEAPDVRSKVIGEFKKGTIVLGLTGEVQAKPSPFKVKQYHKSYEQIYYPQDILWVYDYIGEGSFKVWFKNKTYFENLGFSPYGENSNNCGNSKYCWGELQKPINSIWWVKVKSAEGWVGWSNLSDNFSNKDACGHPSESELR